MECYRQERQAMVKAQHSPAISPPARAVTAPSGRPIVPISHIPAADGSAKSDVARSGSARFRATRRRSADEGQIPARGHERSWSAPARIAESAFGFVTGYPCMNASPCRSPIGGPRSSFFRMPRKPDRNWNAPESRIAGVLGDGAAIFRPSGSQNYST